MKYPCEALVRMLLLTGWLLAAGTLGAQSSSSSTGSGTSTGTNTSSNVPTGLPYEKGEFPEWATDIQRAEILTVGTFPFAVLLSGIVYDYYYWGANGWRSNLQPWPMGSGTSTWVHPANSTELNQKNTALVLAGVGISLGVAVLDWFFGQAERERQLLAAEAEETVLLPPVPGPSSTPTTSPDPVLEKSDAPQP